MLCLSFLFPGKIGKILRKISLLLVFISLIYVLSWVAILKGLDFKMQNSDIADNKVVLDFLVQNSSLGNINLIDLDFYNQEGKKVQKKSDDLPLKIERFSTEPLKIMFAIDDYKSVELYLEILYLKKKFKTKLNKG